MKVIETERLYLRKLVIEDTSELMKVLSDIESMEFYPHPFSEEEVKNWSLVKTFTDIPYNYFINHNT